MVSAAELQRLHEQQHANANGNGNASGNGVVNVDPAAAPMADPFPSLTEDPFPAAAGAPAEYGALKKQQNQQSSSRQSQPDL